MAPIIQGGGANPPVSLDPVQQIVGVQWPSGNVSLFGFEWPDGNGTAPVVGFEITTPAVGRWGSEMIEAEFNSWSLPNVGEGEDIYAPNILGNSGGAGWRTGPNTKAITHAFMNRTEIMKSQTPVERIAGKVFTIAPDLIAAVPPGRMFYRTYKNPVLSGMHEHVEGLISGPATLEELRDQLPLASWSDKLELDEVYDIPGIPDSTGEPVFLMNFEIIVATGVLDLQVSS